MRINYTYYNNIDLFKKVVEFYEPYKDMFKFSVIDDGSQIHPLSRDVVPEWWNLYRIEEDYGWGNEICKNILMKITDEEWNANIDLDHVIALDDEVTLNRLLAIDEGMEGVRTKKRSHQFHYIKHVGNEDYTVRTRAINSYIISRAAWNQTYGYDLAFGWTCGYDFTLFRQLKEFVLPKTKIKQLAIEASSSVFKPEGTGSANNFTTFEEKEAEYIKKGLYRPVKGWFSEKARLANCVELPLFQVL